MSDPLLSLWGGAVTVIGLPDAASCDPESCSCPCLLCLGGMVLQLVGLASLLGVRLRVVS